MPRCPGCGGEKNCRERRSEEVGYEETLLRENRAEDVLLAREVRSAVSPNASKHLTAGIQGTITNI